MTRAKIRPTTVSPATLALRCTRFSLRTLLTVLTLCAIVSWWCGMQLRAQREESSAITRLDRFDCEFTRSTPSNGSFPGRTWLANYCPLLTRVTGISIYGPPWDFSDDDTVILDAFSDLEVLELGTPELTNVGLERVCRGRRDHLVSLVLDVTSVTDAGIEKLGVLPRLRSLSIRSSDIGDRSMHLLSQYPSLEKLTLSCPITDLSLPAFATMPSLRELHLFDTEITEPAIDVFADQHPEIEIEN